MKPAVSLLGGLVAVLGLNVAVLAHDDAPHGEGAAHAAGEGRSVTVIGELIDTACFVHSEGDAVGEGHAECAQACLASGIPAGVLRHGSESHTAMQVLLTNPVPLAEHAARTVRVEGNVYPGMDSVIEPVQVFVLQEDNTWKEVQLKDEHHQPGEGHGHGEDRGHDGRGGHGEDRGHGEGRGHGH